MFFQCCPPKDGPLSNLKVPWCMKGALVHNLCCAMCLAPSMHKRLSLTARAECSLSGFLTFDLFRMLSEERCDLMGVARGSLFLAAQTVTNLQSTALAIAVVACSKDPSFQPWTYGNGRLTEITIEQAFGHLRSQSRNSQLSTRGFFQADARQALKTARHLDQEQVATQESSMEQPLTDSQRLGWWVYVALGFSVFYCFCGFRFF